MARPLRNESAGTLYHVTARGNEERDIYFTDDNRLVFLKVLGKMCRPKHIRHATARIDAPDINPSNTAC